MRGEATGGDAWQAFVRRAIEGEPDDPFVAMLKRALASGSKVMRVNLDETPKGLAYRILMSRLRELSVMEIPHSAAFTRWSLTNGIKLASAEEEARRFAVLAGERFVPIAEELGPKYAKASFVERMRELGAPRTVATLASERVHRTAPGEAQIRARERVDAFLMSLAKDLGVVLCYPEAGVAIILDAAVNRFAQTYLSIGCSDVSRPPIDHGRPGSARMSYPASEALGFVTGPDGQIYGLHFYGENESAAVVTGPSPVETDDMVPVPEVHREHADDAIDARSKLAAWMRAAGWVK